MDSPETVQLCDTVTAASMNTLVDFMLQTSEAALDTHPSLMEVVAPFFRIPCALYLMGIL